MNMEILGGLCLIVKNKDLAAVTIYPYKHRCLAHCSQGQKAYISYFIIYHHKKEAHAPLLPSVT